MALRFGYPLQARFTRHLLSLTPHARWDNALADAVRGSICHMLYDFLAGGSFSLLSANTTSPSPTVARRDDQRFLLINPAAINKSTSERRELQRRTTTHPMLVSRTCGHREREEGKPPTDRDRRAARPAHFLFLGQSVCRRTGLMLIAMPCTRARDRFRPCQIVSGPSSLSSRFVPLLRRGGGDRRGAGGPHPRPARPQHLPAPAPPAPATAPRGHPRGNRPALAHVAAAAPTSHGAPSSPAAG